MTSWKKLKTHTVMIKKGWTLPCLDAVMNPDVQRKATAALLNHSLSLMNDGQTQEPQSISESDARELELQSSMADKEVEDDKEEIDVDASLAAFFVVLTVDWQLVLADQPG